MCTESLHDELLLTSSSASSCSKMTEKFNNLLGYFAKKYQLVCEHSCWFANLAMTFQSCVRGKSARFIVRLIDVSVVLQRQVSAVESHE